MTVARCFLVCVILALPAGGFAQEAVLNGTLTDSTGAVLPGVTVTATNEATGNTFVAVTDEGGRYRIPVRTGTYRIDCELSGFAAVTRTGVQLLVGQAVTINLRMAPSGVSETVTVTGETPLINTTTSTLGGNVDPRQVAELPVAGRNFMALGAAGPGEPDADDERLPAAAGQRAFGRRAGVPDQSRRPAGDEGSRDRRSAQVQSGHDFGIPVHREPVRRDDGPVVRRGGEHHHQVGHQPALGRVPG